MAKMHTRRRGSSGSKKPLLAPTPGWLQYKAEEIEALIVKLAKQGVSPSLIGLTLRDTYGIPDVEKVTGKKLGKILKEKEITTELPEDIQSLIRRATLIKKHLETHKKDMHSNMGLQRIESKIFRLVKYYKRAGRLPADWKYV